MGMAVARDEVEQIHRIVGAHVLVNIGVHLPADARPQRALLVRQRQEIQALLRRVSAPRMDEGIRKAEI